MSQYAQFFLKHNGSYTNIAEFSRSNAIYQLVQHIFPYGQSMKVDTDTLIDLRQMATDQIDGCKKSIRKYQDKITAIQSFNNSVDEKLEAIHRYEEIIEEYEQDIEGYAFAEDFFLILEQMAEYSGNEIYAGIECEKPTD